MGQYYVIVNLDAKQFLSPHACGNGAKLLEFGVSQCGIMSCLAILLADGNGRGGGDLRSENPIIGSWAGDRIVVSGDYADDGNFIPEDAEPIQLDGEDEVREGYNLYCLTDACDEWEDISIKAMRALCEDSPIRDFIREKIQDNPWMRFPAEILEQDLDT